eukprot:jgi/Botrbrau1/4823/Bobra.0325s0039.2
MMSDGQKKRLQACCGTLDVKVVEARNLSPTGELPFPLSAVNPYVTLTVITDGAKSVHQTRVIRNTLAPQWNTSFRILEANLLSSLELTVMHHSKLASDLVLGEAAISLLAPFQNNQPRYMWLTLLNKISGAGAGELRLRVHWTSHNVAGTENLQPTLSIGVSLQGIGLSVIEASLVKLPCEIMHALLESVQVNFLMSQEDVSIGDKDPKNLNGHRHQVAQSGQIKIHSIQIDNQLLTSSHPVVLAQTSMALRHKTEGSDGHTANHGGRSIQQTPCLEINWEMLNHNPSISYFRHLSLTVAPWDVVLEEDFLDRILQLVRSAPLHDFWQGEVSSQTLDGEREVGEALMAVFDATLIQHERKSVGQVRQKCYFENLVMKAVEVNLTLIPNGRRDEAAAVNGFRLAAALGTQFLEINNVPLKINSLQMKNAFLTPRDLIAQISRHFMFQALHEMHKILGQLDIVGSPIVLGSSVIAGFKLLLSEPAKARNLQELVEGVGRGLLALSKNCTVGICSASGQMAGGMAKGFALLTLDEDYIRRFRSRPMGYKQRFLDGLQAAGVGVYEGAVGLVREPVVRYQDHGVVGGLLGVYIGASGVFLKPASGLLQLIASTATGIGSGIRQLGDEVIRVPHTRIRNPRSFGIEAGGEIRNFARWQQILSRLKEGQYSQDTVMDYLQNKENKVLVFTSRRLIYVNLKRQQLRWSFSIKNLMAVSISGLSVILHQRMTIKVGQKSIQLPVHKHVTCRTRDLHQSLLSKLDRALARDRQTLISHDDVIREAPLPQEMSQSELHILNSEPPALGLVRLSTCSGESRLSALISRAPSTVSRKALQRGGKSEEVSNEPSQGVGEEGAQDCLSPIPADPQYAQPQKCQSSLTPGACVQAMGTLLSAADALDLDVQRMCLNSVAALAGNAGMFVGSAAARNVSYSIFQTIEKLALRAASGGSSSNELKEVIASIRQLISVLDTVCSPPLPL